MLDWKVLYMSAFIKNVAIFYLRTEKNKFLIIERSKFKIGYLENDNPPSLVSCCQQLSVLVELDTRYAISWKTDPCLLVPRSILPPALPSVTLSSSVPFTCEKHHWMSLLPENTKVFRYFHFILMLGKVMLGESTFWAKFTPCLCFVLTRHVSAFLPHASLRSDLQEICPKD